MKKIQIVLLLLIFFQIIPKPCRPYKILGLFPYPGMSHFRFYEPLLRGLATAGHNVTVLSLFKHEKPPQNYKEIIIGGAVMAETMKVEDEWLQKRRFYGHYYEMFDVYQEGRDSCENAYKSQELQKIIKQKEHFDLVIVEQFNNDCMLGVAWHINAPVMGLSSCAALPWHYDRMANPQIASYMPSIFLQSSVDMTFFERFYNFLDIQMMKWIYRNYIESYTNGLLKKQFGRRIPPVNELVKRTSVALINQHYSLNGVKALSPAVIEIGGMQIQNEKRIDLKIRKFLDNSTEGVILFSWGSIVRADSLPTTKRNHLIKAFSAFKQKILWKWENDTMPDKPKNVYIHKWLQQREILCHPNVKGFISHGGLMGTEEAVYCGVPILAIPIFGDQFVTAASIANRGIGTIVNYEDITTENIFNAMQMVLSDRVRDQMNKVSYAFRNRAKSPIETAMWWAEHVAATKGELMLKSPAARMSGFVYHSFDVICVLLVGTAIIVGSVMLCLKCLLCRGRQQLEDSNKMKTA